MVFCDGVCIRSGKRPPRKKSKKNDDSDDAIAEDRAEPKTRSLGITKSGNAASSKTTTTTNTSNPPMKNKIKNNNDVGEVRGSDHPPLTTQKDQVHGIQHNQSVSSHESSNSTSSSSFLEKNKINTDNNTKHNNTHSIMNINPNTNKETSDKSRKYSTSDESDLTFVSCQRISTRHKMKEKEPKKVEDNKTVVPSCIENDDGCGTIPHTATERTSAVEQEQQKSHDAAPRGGDDNGVDKSDSDASLSSSFFHTSPPRFFPESSESEQTNAVDNPIRRIEIPQPKTPGKMHTPNIGANHTNRIYSNCNSPTNTGRSARSHRSDSAATMTQSTTLQNKNAYHRGVKSTKPFSSDTTSNTSKSYIRSGKKSPTSSEKNKKKKTLLDSARTLFSRTTTSSSSVSTVPATSSLYQHDFHRQSMTTHYNSGSNGSGSYGGSFSCQNAPRTSVSVNTNKRSDGGNAGKPRNLCSTDNRQRALANARGATPVTTTAATLTNYSTANQERRGSIAESAVSTQSTISASRTQHSSYQPQHQQKPSHQQSHKQQQGSSAATSWSSRPLPSSSVSTVPSTMNAAAVAAVPMPGATRDGEHLHVPIGAIISNRYEVLREAGKGNFATVYACRVLTATGPNSSRSCSLQPGANGGDVVAIKLLKRGHERLMDAEGRVLEMIMAADTHDEYGLIKMRERISDYHGHTGAVFDLKGRALCEMLDVHDRSSSTPSGHRGGSCIGRRPPMAWCEVLQVAYDCGRALHFLHTRVGAVHTDLKTDNIVENEAVSDGGQRGRERWSRFDTGTKQQHYKYCLIDFGTSSPYRREDAASRSRNGIHRTPAADTSALAHVLYELRARTAVLDLQRTHSSSSSGSGSAYEILQRGMQPETAGQRRFVEVLAKAVAPLDPMAPVRQPDCQAIADAAAACLEGMRQSGHGAGGAERMARAHTALVNRNNSSGYTENSLYDRTPSAHAVYQQSIAYGRAATLQTLSTSSHHNTPQRFQMSASNNHHNQYQTSAMHPFSRSSSSTIISSAQASPAPVWYTQHTTMSPSGRGTHTSVTGAGPSSAVAMSPNRSSSHHNSSFITHHHPNNTRDTHGSVISPVRVLFNTTTMTPDQHQQKLQQRGSHYPRQGSSSAPVVAPSPPKLAPMATRTATALHPSTVSSSTSVMQHGHLSAPTTSVTLMQRAAPTNTSSYTLSTSTQYPNRSVSSSF